LSRPISRNLLVILRHPFDLRFPLENGRLKIASTPDKIRHRTNFAAQADEPGGVSKGWKRRKWISAGIGEAREEPTSTRCRLNQMRAGQRTTQVALLLETSTEFGRGLLRGILRYSRLHGPWSLYLAPGHLDQILPNAKSWEGMGIIARIRSPQMEKLIRATRLPFVASSLSESRPPGTGNKFGEIRTESDAIAKMCAMHLFEAGLRRFAYCGFQKCRWSAAREEAFLQFAKERGYPFSAHRITLANWMHRPRWMQSWQHEQPLLVRWLKSLPKPVGLMACNDICGREVLQACTGAGLRVPDEVAVVGVDNDEMMCELSHPPLSSVALSLESAGYRAARLLTDLMNGQSAEGQTVWVGPTHVAVRRSSDVIAQDDSLVAGALSFIREHARQNISVGNIVEELGVSRRTLERRFLRAIGRTVLSEIMRCHLQRAKQLLSETDLPCRKVAAEAGFGSLKTFNRTFSGKEGMTPHTFRRNPSG
jgi:LacI family transcriptional regulator